MRVRHTCLAHRDRPAPGRRRAVVVAAVFAAGGLLGPSAVASAAAATPAVSSAAVLGTSAAVSAIAPGLAGLTPAPPATLSDGLRTTSATVKKANCGALTRKAKRAKGKERKRLNAQAKRCQAGNKAATRALEAIRDGRYVGTRGDGQTVDWIFCANGKSSTRTTGGGSTGVSTGSNWQVTAATANGSSGFTAIVEDKQEGSSVGLVLRGGTWGVGVSRAFGTVESIGTVVRTDAKTECAAL